MCFVYPPTYTYTAHTKPMFMKVLQTLVSFYSPLTYRRYVQREPQMIKRSRNTPQGLDKYEFLWQKKWQDRHVNLKVM